MITEKTYATCLGALCLMAALAVLANLAYVYIDQELTYGAFIKAYWPNQLLGVALVALGLWIAREWFD